MTWHSLYLVFIFSLVLALANHWLYPSANGNDLYPRWYGTHVLLHGVDPYGRQVTEESERHNYGQVLSANLRSSGVAEGVIMRIGGWKMRSVFERYAIITTARSRTRSSAWRIGVASWVPSHRSRCARTSACRPR
jgi:hypothetical protein